MQVTRWAGLLRGQKTAASVSLYEPLDQRAFIGSQCIGIHKPPVPLVEGERILTAQNRIRSAVPAELLQLRIGGHRYFHHKNMDHDTLQFHNNAI